MRDLFTPKHSPCLPTLARIAAAGSAERLAFVGPRFARGCGGGRFVVRAYGVTGRGWSWAEAAGNWAAGALEVTCAN